MSVLIPPFKWAEREDRLFVTIELNDLPSSTDIKINEESVAFNAEKDGKKFELNLVLNGKINKDKSTFAVRPRSVELLLIKDSEGYWNRLLKDKNAYKVQCKIDWDLWKDEDDDEEKSIGNFGMDDGMGRF